MLQSNITPDWNRRVRIEDENIILRIKNTDRAAKVTVGLPTFNRPDTLRRALSSLAHQTFRDFVVIVSDNAGVNQATIDAVQEVGKDLPEVYLIAQESNTGALGNLSFLLGCANTKYFMWLADDDEISENYLEKLVSLLECEPAAVCAMGRWRMMRNAHQGENRWQLENSTANRALRIFVYIACEPDDYFFYGLHRTEQLRRCHFDGYFYPNSKVLTNCCYVFLFDLLWQGPVKYSREATWICHNYSEKSYNRAHANGLSDKLKTLARRINIYLLYCTKTAKKSPLLLLVSIPAAFIGFTRDLATAAGRMARRITGMQG
jgi:glycosyltransferase involved in cell wall biosynthesis